MRCTCDEVYFKESTREIYVRLAPRAFYWELSYYLSVCMARVVVAS